MHELGEPIEAAGLDTQVVALVSLVLLVVFILRAIIRLLRDTLELRNAWVTRPRAGRPAWHASVVSASPLDEIRAQRLAFLQALYDAAEGGEARMVKYADVVSAVGFDDDLAEKVQEYLNGEGLLQWAAFGMIELTHAGVREVEQALHAPTRPTDHFPPLVIAQNYINVGSMNQSQIQQGTTFSSQGFGDVDSLRELVVEIRAVVTAIGLSADESEELHAELATVDAQLGSPRPKWRLIREGLSSARTILENAAGTGMARATPQLGVVIEKLAHAIRSLPL